MRFRHRLTLGILLAAVILLSACSSIKVSNTAQNTAPEPTAPEPQCKKDADCMRVFGSTLGVCQYAFCEKEICRKRPVQDCCGNGVQEEIENNITGSKCTCPEDYGKCEGNLVYMDSRGREQTSSYIFWACNANAQCEMQYEDTLQKTAEYFTTFAGSGFSFNFYVSYPNPFYHNSSEFRVEYKLTDLDTKVVDPSIKFTEIRLMEGTNILYRAGLNLKFSKVGQTNITMIPMSSYDIIYPEEKKSVILSLDYEYIPLKKTVDADKNEMYTPMDPERKKYQTTIRDPVIFLEKAVAEN